MRRSSCKWAEAILIRHLRNTHLRFSFAPNSVVHVSEMILMGSVMLASLMIANAYEGGLKSIMTIPQ